MARGKDMASVLKAARQGNAHELEGMLENVPSDGLDRFGASPLSSACYHGHYECVKVLLDHGANPRATFAYGDTPLHQATRSGSAQCAALLAERVLKTQGMEGVYEMLSAKDSWGRTALHVAVKTLRLDVLKVFTMYLPRVDEWLRETSLPNDGEFINYICRGERIVDSDDGEGDTMLHDAVRSGSTDLVEYLLQHLGPHPLAENAFGETPVDVAGHCENEQMSLMVDLYTHRFVQMYGEARIAPRHRLPTSMAAASSRRGDTKPKHSPSGNFEYHDDLERSLLQPPAISTLERVVLQQCSNSAETSGALLAIYQGKAQDGQKLMLREYIEDEGGLEELCDKIADLYTSTTSHNHPSH